VHPPMRSDSSPSGHPGTRVTRAPRALLLGATLGLVAVAAGLAACSGGDPDALLRPSAGGPGGPTTDPSGSSTTPGGGEPPPVVLECTEKPPGRSYQGFDGVGLEAARVNENIGLNRGRIKPFAVLAGEYTRVLGRVPAGLAAESGSFETPPARWYEEPRATGVGLATLYTVSFEGALAYAKADPKFAAAPTAATAATECGAFMAKAWSRTASPNEITECVTLATTKLDKETNPQRKWAYVFASVLTSTGFLTY
jgi:hypothetical protein